MPAELFVAPGTKIANKEGFAKFGAFVNTLAKERMGRPLVLACSADLAESTSIIGFAQDFKGVKGFGWYVRDLSRFSVHGSVAAVVVFLMWVYVSAVILIYGVEFTVAYARLRRGISEEKMPVDAIEPGSEVVPEAAPSAESAAWAVRTAWCAGMDTFDTSAPFRASTSTAAMTRSW